jgi:hypothetical protein
MVLQRGRPASSFLPQQESKPAGETPALQNPLTFRGNQNRSGIRMEYSGLDLRPTETSAEMIVDHAGGLHERVANG